MDGHPLHIDPAQKLALDVRDTTFAWEESLAVKDAKEAAAKKKKGKGPVVADLPSVDDAPPFEMRDVNMQVARGTLVAIVGAVGSGKVCFLSLWFTVICFVVLIRLIVHSRVCSTG